MKLVRYGAPGKEKPGMIDDDGKLRDLSGRINDIDAKAISPVGLKKLQRINPTRLPLVKGKKRFGPPIADPRKFIAVGLNYTDHAAETGLDAPKEPIIFTKHVNCLSGANDDVVLPRWSKKGDWEVELGFIMGGRVKNVTKKDALSYVAGYCIVNDVSERGDQIERGGQWTKGKSHDTFGPVGPWLVTSDEVGNPQRLNLTTEVNGQRMQDGSTKNMIFNVATLVSYISKFITLEAGDIVCSGTPAGVGLGMRPQQFLKPGDVMHLSIDKLGVQTQKVVRG